MSLATLTIAVLRRPVSNIRFCVPMKQIQWTEDDRYRYLFPTTFVTSTRSGDGSQALRNVVLVLMKNKSNAKDLEGSINTACSSLPSASSVSTSLFRFRLFDSVSSSQSKMPTSYSHKSLSVSPSFPSQHPQHCVLLIPERSQYGLTRTR